MQTKLQEQQLFTVKEAQEFLGKKAIGLHAVRQKMTSGEIPSFFDGKKYITHKKQLLAYANKMNVEAELITEKVRKGAVPSARKRRQS